MLSSNQIRERCLPLLRESQSLLPPLEEMEKNITGFYQALEKASHVSSTRDSESPTEFKQKCQVTIAIFHYVTCRAQTAINNFLKDPLTSDFLTFVLSVKHRYAMTIKFKTDRGRVFKEFI